MTADDTPPRDSPMAEGLLGGSTGSVSGLGERLSVRNDGASGVLQDAGLLGGGGRDRDRLRLIKYAVNHSEGVAIAKAVKDVFGKDSTGGDDADYQVARRLYTENPTYFDTFQQNRLTTVEPKLGLLDLIAQGVTQKSPSDRDGDLPSNAAGGAEAGDFVTDKGFTENLLRSVPALNDDGKEIVANALGRYVKRINDYRLLFRAEVLGGRGGESTFIEEYKTRFNDPGRIRKQWAKYNAALRFGRENYSNATLATLTTDPKKHGSLYEAVAEINENFNRLMSWMAYRPKTKATSRPGYRPPYLKFLEFSEAGYPHLHVLFFDVPTKGGRPWLINKGALSNKWDELGQGRIVDLEALTLKENLPECYDVEESAGFISWEEARRADRAAETARSETSELVGGGPAGEAAEEAAARVADRVAHYDVAALRSGGAESGEDASGAAGGSGEGESSEAVADGGEDVMSEFAAQTAGQYIGKYLSATFGGLMNLATSEEYEAEGKYADKAETYKLGLYWATGRKMWSLSRDIEEEIAPEEPEEVDLPVVVEFVGTYLYWDLPAQVLSAARPLAELEDAKHPSAPEVGGEDGDRPPPEPAD